MDNFAAAFNEWFRRYINEPERFSREFEDVLEFLEEENSGAEPTYGESQAAYFRKLLEEV